jgi:BASS family bile acid:Na+ symporter
MLFVSFCKVAPGELRPHRWMLKLLGIQVGSFTLMGLLIALMPDVPGRVVIESAMICMICPTATAAAVVTTKLHGNPSAVVSYTCLINLTASIAIPSVVSFIHEGAGELDFLTSFTLIIGRVFPLLILPLLSAWFVRYMMPRFHRRILSYPDLAFYLWAVALSLAIGITVKAIVHSHESLLELILIALASLLTCLVQFYWGHSIGKKHHETIAGTQALGQKNTIFAIWMGYTFLNPVTAMAGGFYSVWHNVINSWQLWREHTTHAPRCVKKQSSFQ